MKTYQEALDWMFGRLPYYQRQGKKAMKKDLTNIRAFLAHMGHPERKVPVIHVGGTNGKGSVSSMLASILQEAGYRTGLYTSPHLLDFRERIRVNGKEIPRKVVLGFVRRYKDFIEEQGLSFFELTVGMAFYYFRKIRVDVAVMEVGLGGRLDSTNVAHSILSIITNVDYDHTDVLGDTLEAIAREKAGIIKEGVPVVIGDMPEEAKEEILRIARERQSEVSEAQPLTDEHWECELEGAYQEKNMAVALAAVNKLRNKGWRIPAEAVYRGLKYVKTNTGLRGRWEILSETPAIILDVGHNPAAFSYIVPALKKKIARQKILLLGFVEGKDVEAIARMLPRDWIYVLTSPGVERAMDVKAVEEIFRQTGLCEIQAFDHFDDALCYAYNLLTPRDLLFVGGSTFMVAQTLPLFRFRRGKVVGVKVAGCA